MSLNVSSFHVGGSSYSSDDTAVDGRSLLKSSEKSDVLFLQEVGSAKNPLITQLKTKEFSVSYLKPHGKIPFDTAIALNPNRFSDVKDYSSIIETAKGNRECAICVATDKTTGKRVLFVSANIQDPNYTLKAGNLEKAAKKDEFCSKLLEKVNDIKQTDSFDSQVIGIETKPKKGIASRNFRVFAKDENQLRSTATRLFSGVTKSPKSTNITLEKENPKLTLAKSKSFGLSATHKPDISALVGKVTFRPGILDWLSNLINTLFAKHVTKSALAEPVDAMKPKEINFAQPEIKSEIQQQSIQEAVCHNLHKTFCMIGSSSQTENFRTFQALKQELGLMTFRMNRADRLEMDPQSMMKVFNLLNQLYDDPRFKELCKLDHKIVGEYLQIISKSFPDKIAAGLFSKLLIQDLMEIAGNEKLAIDDRRGAFDLLERMDNLSAQNLYQEQINRSSYDTYRKNTEGLRLVTANN